MITTDITYPAELPIPLRDGYSPGYTNNIRRTQMASGRSRNRRVFETVNGSITAKIQCTDTQALLFESFYNLAGANWFNMPLRLPGSVVRNYVVRFSGIFGGPNLVANLWQYTCSLELYERESLSGNWAQYAPQMVTGADVLDVAVNEKLP